MKQLLYFTFAAFIVVSCSNDTTTNDETNIESQSSNIEDSEVVNNNEIERFTSDNNGSNKKDYQEYHENGSLKIEGDLDEKGERHGLWISYYETGVKWSESFYTHGKRNGHSITFYPNGKVRYIGEYENDKQIGTWQFNDEEGNLISEETY